ncbi:MAG: hypothetical protein WKG07_40465 [Hymenobacter sp.]
MFVSHAVAAAAVARGHQVTCAARGVSGSVPVGAELVRVDRDQPDGLEPLDGRTFDAVVDVESLSFTRVRRALGGARSRGWALDLRLDELGLRRQRDAWAARRSSAAARPRTGRSRRDRPRTVRPAQGGLRERGPLGCWRAGVRLPARAHRGAG